MFLRMKGSRVTLAALGLLAGCSHSDPIAPADPEGVGPFSAGSPARLTFSAADDRFANWTDDGEGIFYSFQVPNRPDRDRCLGLLPAEGGTRLFELCEHRGAFADSTDFFASGALSTDGKLLYVQATSRRNAQLPGVTRLYLSDTTSRAVRRVLITMPIALGTTSVDWLADMHWTGPDTFIGLAQQFTVVSVGAGAARDTVFVSVGMVRGTVTAQGATLSLIAGTEGVVNYSLIEGGAALIIWTGGLSLQRVPIGGGSPTVSVTLPPGDVGINNRRIISHSCRNTTCFIVAFQVEFSPLGGNQQFILFQVDIASGTVRQYAGVNNPLPAPIQTAWTAVRLSPTADNAVLSFTTLGNADLSLYKGFLP